LDREALRAVSVLYAIALRHFGATGAAMIGRECERGTLVRVGDSSSADLRLAGVGASAADIFCDGATWRIRRPDGSIRPVVDGDAIAIGPWTVVLVLGEGDSSPVDRSEPDDDLDLPRFSVLSGGAAYMRGTQPALLGASPWCELLLSEMHLPVAAIACRSRTGTTCVYPIPAVALRRNGRRVASRVSLRDGDRLEAGGTDGCVVVFSDPREELDRLIGAIRREPRVASAPDASPRWRQWLDRAHVDATPLEALLIAIGFAVAVAYALLVWLRW
jgi:hypothetical protein